MKNIELLDKYFGNSLSPKEQLLFNELLQNDESFKTEFLFQKDLKKAISLNKQEILKKTLQNFEKDIKPKPPIFFLTKKWLVAASIVLFVGLSSALIKISFYPSTERLYSQNFEPYRNIVQPIVRGEISNSIEYSAFLAYENQDYHKAINLFNSIDNQNSAYVPFYKAMCYLSLNKTNEAIDLLESLISNSYLENPDKKLSFKAEWYLGLAYLKSGNKEKAISQFLIVIGQPCEECKKKKLAENIINHLD